MNSRFLIDTYAWIEYSDGTEKGNSVRKIINNENNKIYTSFICISEIISKARRNGINDVEQFEMITNISEVIFPDINDCKEVGLIHAMMKKKEKDFGLADAFVIQAAKKMNARIVTGDPHFKLVKGSIMI